MEPQRSPRPPVNLRPTVPADLPYIIGEPLPFRVKAITVLAGDTILGMGGIAFPPGGTVWAFVQQTAEAKRYPVAFHRAGLMAMRMIRDLGLSEVLATADQDNDPARRWLSRLGFVEAQHQVVDGKLTFLWCRDR
jgi:hypothetical protein